EHKLPEFTWKTGPVTIGANLATIALPEEYRFLESKQARVVLEEIWGNPKDPDVLGLMFPPNQGPETENGWAVVVSWDDSGYVKDDDARSINYDDLLKQMQEETREANKARKKQGYPTVDLLGWAEQPHYDATKKTLYWAKRLKFDGTEEPQLNYNMRVLGRRGVLELNPLGAESVLSKIREAAPVLLSATTFTQGNRYEDFSESSGDKVAAYGIAGLLGVGLLAKAGILKLLLKPLIIVGAIIVGVVGKIMGGRKNNAS
ncbi:MAG TPA: DUF2167 domain-containing protein, partial [Planctomycetota bacterium]|nr:DUF2167 domain-containing protein [Planctomycetota bacterium]